MKENKGYEELKSGLRLNDPAYIQKIIEPLGDAFPIYRKDPLTAGCCGDACSAKTFVICLVIFKSYTK